MARVVRVVARPEYRLFVEFDDGESCEFDLSSRLFGPMFEPLRDPVFFRLVVVDEFGAPCWPNGADLAPDALRQILRNRALREAVQAFEAESGPITAEEIEAARKAWRG